MQAAGAPRVPLGGGVFCSLLYSLILVLLSLLFGAPRVHSVLGDAFLRGVAGRRVSCGGVTLPCAPFSPVWRGSSGSGESGGFGGGRVISPFLEVLGGEAGFGGSWGGVEGPPLRVSSASLHAPVPGSHQVWEVVGVLPVASLGCLLVTLSLEACLAFVFFYWALPFFSLLLTIFPC